jgi:hypothetical protein
MDELIAISTYDLGESKVKVTGRIEDLVGAGNRASDAQPLRSEVEIGLMHAV